MKALSRLEELFISEEFLDKEALVRIIKPFVRINREKGIIILLPISYEKSNEDIVLLYLLARKARSQGLGKYEEKAAPREIIADLEIPIGSVKTSLHGLKKKKLINKDEKGYYVPNHNLPTIEKRIGGNKE